MVVDDDCLLSAELSQYLGNCDRQPFIHQAWKVRTFSHPCIAVNLFRKSRVRDMVTLRENVRIQIAFPAMIVSMIDIDLRKRSRSGDKHSRMLAVSWNRCRTQGPNLPQWISQDRPCSFKPPQLLVGHNYRASTSQ